MMLKTNATTGLKPASLRRIRETVSGAPHSLQYCAPATTTGWPHREQNRGFSNSVSATECERHFAEPYRVAIVQPLDGHAPIANEGAVLAVEVLHLERTVARFNARVVAGD